MPFFSKAQARRTHTHVAVEFKGPIKTKSKISLSSCETYGLQTGIKSKHPQFFCKLFGEKKSSGPVTERVKRVHVCWAPAFSIFYCLDLWLFLRIEILLENAVNTFYKPLKESGYKCESIHL